MDWQNILVGMILLLVAIVILVWLWKILTRMPKRRNTCQGCANCVPYVGKVSPSKTVKSVESPKNREKGVPQQ